MTSCDHCSIKRTGAISEKGVWWRERWYCSSWCFRLEDPEGFHRWDYREHHEDPQADREPPEREDD